MKNERQAMLFVVCEIANSEDAFGESQSEEIPLFALIE